jgi:hypothetical protein
MFCSLIISNLFIVGSLNILYDFINRLITTLIMIFVTVIILTDKGQDVVVLKPVK